MSHSTTASTIEEERRAKYCGTASLRVEALSFNHRNKARPGSAAAKNTAVLTRIFREESECRQEDVQNHATAIISRQDLEAALANSNITGTSLVMDTLPYPQLELPVGVSLECLQGHDRLAAANDVFQGSCRRWVVDLYLDDLSDDLKQMLIDDYKHQRKPCDGEIYYKIRKYQGKCGKANEFFKRLWLGRLTVSKSRREKFQQLLDHKEYLAAFDAFLQIPALLAGLRISVLHETRSMQCDEQHLHYLRYTHHWWYKVCEGKPELMQRIDRPTVEILQGKAPGASIHDHDSLSACFRNREIFSDIPDEHRDGFWVRTLENSRHCLIPSLFTFFEDQKFLHRVSESMRYIVDVKRRAGVSGELCSAFEKSAEDAGDTLCLVQLSDYHFSTIPGNRTTRMALGVRQLWLYAIREFESLPPIPRKKSLLAKPRAKFDERVLYDFAGFASQLGFQTAKIDKILSRPLDGDIAERALDKARRPDCYEYDNKEQLVAQIVNIFAAARPISPELLLEEQHLAEPRLPPTRYGLPEAADHARDKSLLFLPQMKAASVGSIQNHVSSFFVRTSVYLAYFGDLPQLPERLVSNEQAMTPANTVGIGEDCDMGLSEEPLINAWNPVQQRQEVSWPHRPEVQPDGEGFLCDESPGWRSPVEQPPMLSWSLVATSKNESRQNMSAELAKAREELNSLRDLASKEQDKLNIVKKMVQDEQLVLDSIEEKKEEASSKERKEQFTLQETSLECWKIAEKLQETSLEYRKTEEKLQNLQSLVEAAEEMLQDAKVQVQKERKVLDDNQILLQGVKNETKDLRRVCKKAQQQRQHLQQVINNRQNDLDAIKKDAQREQSAYLDLQEKCQELDQHITSQKHQLQQVKDKIVDKQQNLNYLRSRIIQSEEKLKTLQRRPQRQQALLPVTEEATHESAGFSNLEADAKESTERDLAQWRKELDQEHAALSSPHVIFGHMYEPNRGSDKHPVSRGRERFKVLAQQYERRGLLLYDLSGKALHRDAFLDGIENNAPYSVLLKRAPKLAGSAQDSDGKIRSDREIKKCKRKRVKMDGESGRVEEEKSENEGGADKGGVGGAVERESEGEL